MGKVRIGIDVGGTFTDAAVISNENYELIAKMKIPTTHEEGVAQGIIRIITQLIKENNIDPKDVVFIAHGTTQATNALLEGDVAQVGILGMGTGLDGRSARKETNVEKIELAPEKYLNPHHMYLDSAELTTEKIKAAIEELKKENSEVIVASEAYSVDDPTNEKEVIKISEESGLYATGGHEISQLYGLKMRTRTAVVNASLIPRMMQTADMTEQAIIDSKIESNLMIMRCDGGVMSIDEVRQRPILTMLSGLAAGVAGALMYEKVSDGIFFEVGGTSIDISVIKNGQVMIKYAQVGGHKTYLRSLDVRTMGIAGGSMIRVQGKKVVDVGPRSAHIAGLEYECFGEATRFEGGKIELIAPRAEDPSEYVSIVNSQGQAYSLTLAGAANLLGYVPAGDYAKGDEESTQKAWKILGDYLAVSAEEAARQVMDIAMRKLTEVINELVQEYELDKKYLTFVGGGGSAAICVPSLAEYMGVEWKIAENAPYISTIGVALAMVKEQMERTVLSPTDTDIMQIRRDIMEKIVRSGANEETVEINIEIDAQKNILRAIATGSTELRNKDLNAKDLTQEEKKQLAAEALQVEVGTVKEISSTGRWTLLESEIITKKLFLKFKQQSCCVIDREGVVRFKKDKVAHLVFKKGEVQRRFIPFIDENTEYSDANASIPKTLMFFREKMLDLTGMHTLEQLLSVSSIEIENLNDEEEIIAVAYK